MTEQTEVKPKISSILQPLVEESNKKILEKRKVK